jgi:hypothetical protein
MEQDYFTVSTPKRIDIPTWHRSLKKMRIDWMPLLVTI